VSVGAVFCSYEDSGFLTEAVNRVYAAMDSILILLDTVPWTGMPNNAILETTYKTALAIPDHQHKIEIISRYWADEAEQRNYGLKVLRDKGIDWGMMVDDDELFNPSELSQVFPMLNVNDYSAYLVKHQIYWKNRDTIIDFEDSYFPTIMLTLPNRIIFNKARMITVYEGKQWTYVRPDLLICHHMSFVRRDDLMLRKIQMFSHADEIIKGWYEEKWLKWEESMTDLHPLNPSTFKRTVPATTSKYILEEVK